MLFNKSSNGKQELKALLGFIYASKEFVNMVTDIEIAQDEIITLVGPELFSAIETHYQSVDYLAAGQEDPHKLLMDKLVHVTQLPIAFYAYKSYSSNADITHSDKGRQIFVSETEKPAFQWMIDKDDQALLSKAHKFSDRLLQFLDKNKSDETIKEFWTESESFKASKNNLIGSTGIFDSIFPISNSPRFYQTVCPFIREAELTRIIPVLSGELYEDLLSVVRGATGSEFLNTILLHARNALVFHTMAIAARRLSVEVLPNGVFQNYTPGIQSISAKQPASKDITHEVSQMIEREANSALTRLQQQLALKAATDQGIDLSVQIPTDRRSTTDQHFRV